MPFLHSSSLDIVSMKRQKMPMDARRWVLLSSSEFPSTTNFTMGESSAGYYGYGIWPIFINFMILVEVAISMEPRFSVGNLILVLQLAVEISVPIGSTSFLVLDPMVDILTPVGSSPFLVQVGVFDSSSNYRILVFNSKSWFLDFSFIAYTLCIFQGCNVEPHFGIDYVPPPFKCWFQSFGSSCVLELVGLQFVDVD